MSSDYEPLRDQGRRLRAECADEERKLWAHLRARRFAGFKFSRQHHIGPYFADFCCVTRHRIIELVGNQHAELEQECTDPLRTAGLTEQGYRVMRFWNAAVNTEIEDVLEAIYAALPGSLIARLGRRADPRTRTGGDRRPSPPVRGRKLQRPCTNSRHGLPACEFSPSGRDKREGAGCGNPFFRSLLGRFEFRDRNWLLS